MKILVKKKNNKPEKKDPRCREMGIKLRTFREKLALDLGEKKLNQDVFGLMFGAYSPRAMSSYEKGVVEIPSLLLYTIWEHGCSIDGLFSYQEINEAGIRSLRELYLRTVTRKQKVDQLVHDATERALEGAQDTDGKNEEKG